MVKMARGEGSTLVVAAMGRGRSHQMETFTSTAIPVFESTQRSEKIQKESKTVKQDKIIIL